MQNRLILAAVLALGLCACGQKPQADATPAVGSDTAAPAANAETRTVATAPVNPTFSIDKPSLADCTGVEATVSWDVRTTHPQVSDVEIWVGPDSAPTLFAAGGTSGTAMTGAWTAPGAIFRLRDKASGEEIERLTVTGPACGA